MSEAHYSQMEEWERAEITRLTIRASDLLAENKRLTEANKELEDIIDAKYDNREHAVITAENQRLKREIEQRDKYIKLVQTHVLPKRLGKWDYTILTRKDSNSIGNLLMIWIS